MFGLFGAALGAAGSILGGISRNNALETQQEYVERKKRENQNWYNRRYNEDATQRTDAQRILSLTEEAIKRRNRAAEGRKAVMGGTDESVAAEKEANSKAMADATSQIAAAGEARKDAIEQQYLQKKEGYDNQLAGLDSQKMSGLDFVGSAIGGAYGGFKSFNSLAGLFGSK
jgi:hypothetical protein